MSKVDYQKENIDSLKESAIIVSVVVSGYMILKWGFKMTPPTAKLDITDVAKLGGGIAAGVLVKDYAVSQKWIDPL